MINLPDDQKAAPDWQWTWTGYELELTTVKQWSAAHIRNLRSAFSIMARVMTARGIERPEDVTKQHLAAYLADQAKARRGNGYRNLWQHLATFWRWWAAEEPGRTNPMASIPRPKLPQTTTKVLTPAEIEALLKAAKSARDRALVTLLLETGLRRAEAAALDVEDVDLKARTAKVRRGKLGKSRVVVFGKASAKALWQHLKHSPGTGPLFPGYKGRRITPGTVGDILRRLGRAAGIEGMHTHLCRHAWAHVMLAGQVQEHDVMELAGWTSTAQLRRYGAAMSQQRAIAAGHRHQMLDMVRT